MNIIPPHWHDTDGWNTPSCKTRTSLCYIVSVTDADVLIFTIFNRINSAPALYRSAYHWSPIYQGCFTWYDQRSELSNIVIFGHHVDFCIPFYFRKRIGSMYNPHFVVSCKHFFNVVPLPICSRGKWFVPNCFTVHPAIVSQEIASCRSAINRAAFARPRFSGCYLMQASPELLVGTRCI